MTTSFGPSGAPGIAGAGRSGGSGTSMYGYGMDHDRVVRKEVNLGVIREMTVPEDLIYTTIAPFMEVPTDDFIFDRVTPHFSTGMVPARAQNAESELAQHDFKAGGQARGSVIDWAHKDFYDATDVYNYRAAQDVLDRLGGTVNVPAYLQGSANDLASKMARDQADRVARIHRRFEHIVMTSLSTGTYVYNGTNISFETPWGQPADQRNITPESGSYAADTHDPINDILKIQEDAFERYGIQFDRVLGSRKAFNTFFRSKKFIPRTGFTEQQGIGMDDMPYLVGNAWGPQAGLDFVMQQTGLRPIIHDSVYREDGVAKRYLPQDQLIFLPSESSIRAFDSTAIGFAKTCTSPHPEGNFTAGMYEWEDTQKDPWQLVAGTGIKAYPIMNHMECVYSMKLELPA